MCLTGLIQSQTSQTPLNTGALLLNNRSLVPNLPLIFLVITADSCWHVSSISPNWNVKDVGVSLCAQIQLGQSSFGGKFKELPSLGRKCQPGLFFFTVCLNNHYIWRPGRGCWITWTCLHYGITVVLTQTLLLILDMSTHTNSLLKSIDVFNLCWLTHED